MLFLLQVKLTMKAREYQILVRNIGKFYMNSYFINETSQENPVTIIK